MQEENQAEDTVTVPAEDVTVEIPAQAVRDAAERAAEEDAAESPDVVEGAADAAADVQDELVQGAQDIAGEGSALADLIDADRIERWGGIILTWVREDVLTVNALIQIALVFGCVIPAIIFGPRLKELIGRHLRKRVPAGILRRVADAAATLATPIAAWLTLTAFMAILQEGFQQSDDLVSAAQSLLAAWIVVRLVTLAIRSPFWSKVAFYVAWPIAALDAFGILGDVFDWMREKTFSPSPEVEAISLFDVLRAILIFLLVMQLAKLATGVLVSRMSATEELNPSLKALIAKVLNFTLPVIALLVALGLIGFDLASLAIFGGAVGLGIGLGLQKIIGNFLAGFTLLADRSIKPGDVIQVGDTFGWITDMKSRYVSIRTRDGTEHLIPNATFMDEGVVNWSHNDRAVRVKAEIGVSYATQDLRLVQRICVESAKDTPRVLDKPSPVCNLIGFGDSSVNFSLRFWINDPPNGIANVKSEVLFKVWDGLKAANIEIPFPQRDLHIKSSDVAFAADWPEAAE